MPTTFIKRRASVPPGSIPDRLEMFAREVRFYREVAPSVGVRVPALVRAEERDGATLLELEDLSSWLPGAEPMAAAPVLATLHARWEGNVLTEWPWLARADVSDLVERLYAETWPRLRRREDLTAGVLGLGDALVGQVAVVEQWANAAGTHTLTHGDPSQLNMRTSPTGEIALLDWEDVGTGPGICDLAWLLVSSVEPAQWDSAIQAYGDAAGLDGALREAVVQGLLSLADENEGSADALGRIARLEAAADRI